MRTAIDPTLVSDIIMLLHRLEFRSAHSNVVHAQNDCKYGRDALDSMLIQLRATRGARTAFAFLSKEEATCLLQLELAISGRLVKQTNHLRKSADNFETDAVRNEIPA